jgi:hypothetical protein
VTICRLPWPETDQSISWQQVVEQISGGSDQRWHELQEFCFDSTRIRRSHTFCEYALKSFADGRNIVDAAMELTRRINEDFEYDTKVTDVHTPTEKAFATSRLVNRPENFSTSIASTTDHSRHRSRPKIRAYQARQHRKLSAKVFVLVFDREKGAGLFDAKHPSDRPDQRGLTPFVTSAVPHRNLISSFSQLSTRSRFPDELNGVDDHVTVGVGVANLDRRFLAGIESECAERDEVIVIGSILLIDRDLAASIH